MKLFLCYLFLTVDQYLGSRQSHKKKSVRNICSVRGDAARKKRKENPSINWVDTLSTNIITRNSRALIETAVILVRTIWGIILHFLRGLFRPCTKNCPGCHGLQLCKIPGNAKGTCDFCKNEFPSGTRMFGCRICNSDLCQVCAEAANAPTDPLFPRLVPESETHSGNENFPGLACADIGFLKNSPTDTSSNGNNGSSEKKRRRKKKAKKKNGVLDRNGHKEGGINIAEDLPPPSSEPVKDLVVEDLSPSPAEPVKGLVTEDLSPPHREPAKGLVTENLSISSPEPVKGSVTEDLSPPPLERVKGLVTEDSSPSPLEPVKGLVTENLSISLPEPVKCLVTEDLSPPPSERVKGVVTEDSSPSPLEPVKGLVTENFFSPPSERVLKGLVTEDSSPSPPEPVKGLVTEDLSPPLRKREEGKFIRAGVGGFPFRQFCLFFIFFFAAKPPVYLPCSVVSCVASIVMAGFCARPGF